MTGPGFDMGCVTAFQPSPTMRVTLYTIPEVPWLTYDPGEFTVNSGKTFQTTTTFVPDTPGVYETYRVDEYEWYAYPYFEIARFFVPDTFKVLSPQPAARWRVGEPDTIRWYRDTARNVEIRFSADGGANYILLTTVATTESTYVWNPPDSLATSIHCMIRLTDALDPSVDVRSGEFTLRAYELLRAYPDGSPEPFTPANHGWRFLNSDAGTLWPRSWWQTRFDYANGVDPYTGTGYPAATFQRCEFIEGVSACPTDSDFADWVSWVETFGVSACYGNSILSGNPSSYTHHATALWKRCAEPYGGSCFGLAVTSLLAFLDPVWLQTTFPALPAFDALLTVQMDANVRNLIAHFYSYQFGIDQWNYDQAGAGKPPKQTLNELKAKLISDDPDVNCVLNMRNQNGSGGHTMVPYRVVTDPVNPSWARIYVYDSNNPIDNTVYVRVDTVADTWTDMTGLGFSGGGKGLFLDLSVGNFRHQPLLRNLPSAEPGVRPSAQIISPMTVFTAPGTEAVIVSPSGDSAGFAGGRAFENSVNITALIPKTGAPHPPIGYRMNDGPHAATLGNFAGPTSDISVVYDDAIYEYERANAAAGEVDRFSFARGLAVVNVDTILKHIHLRTVVVDTATETEFDVLHLDLLYGDSVRMEKLDSVSMSLENYGGPKSYDLEVQTSSPLGSWTFRHPAVQVEGNSTQRLVIADDTLGAVKILIDLGNDGSVDDSVLVTNEVTGVDQDDDAGVPDSYALQQNYPNPFNPTTEIRFDIPVASVVRLTIFNILGQEIGRLVDGHLDAASYVAHWDASGYGNGIYYLRLEADAVGGSRMHIQTRKMALVK